MSKEDSALYDDNLQEQRDEILALQSIYNTDDDHKVKIISDVNQEGKGRISIVVSVSVKPVCDQIQVHVAVPNVEDEEELLGAAAACEKQQPFFPENVNVKMNRSISGRNWEGLFEVKHLSPLLMYITFPTSYPSHDPPESHISCSWLTPIQIRSLIAPLNQLWQDTSSMPIVFTWIDWLENNTLEHLGITEHLTLHGCQPDEKMIVEDESSTDILIPWEEEVGQVVASLIQYNREILDIEFCQNQHLCEVCYDEKPGTQFFGLRECNHKFCHECMMAFCEMHVKDGTVEELRCPDTKCDSLIPPYIVQAVLGPDAYDRWEKLLLQKTLDAMGDTMYCPRCQSVVIGEEEKDLYLAHCTVCYFSFCTQCKQCWHQGSACQTDEEHLKIVQKRRNDFSLAEQKKYDEIIRKLEEEMASKAVVKKTMRNCPCCKIPVEKIGGCNKMTCKCGTSFCWVCGISINGYCHFRTAKCVLFPGQTPLYEDAMRQRQRPPDAVLRIRARLAVNPDLQHNQVRCPMCKQVNLKANKNNHLKCWNCKSNFCFLCNARISGCITNHFKGPCVQHS